MSIVAVVRVRRNLLSNVSSFRHFRWVRDAKELDVEVIADLQADVRAVPAEVERAPDERQPQHPILGEELVEVLIEEENRRAGEARVEVVHLALRHVRDDESTRDFGGQQAERQHVQHRMVQIQARLRLLADDERWDDDQQKRKDRRDDAGAGDRRAVLSGPAFTEYPAEVDEHERGGAQRERSHEEPQRNAQQLRRPRVHSEKERNYVNHHDADLRFRHVELAEPQGAGDVRLPVRDVEQDDGTRAVQIHIGRVVAEAGRATRGNADDDGGDAVTPAKRIFVID